VAVDVNVTSLTRDAAQFTPINALNRSYLFPGTPYFGFYETCTVYERGVCLVRGLPGTSSRVSAQVSWRRQFVDSIGQVFTPFTYLRGDLLAYSPSLGGYQNAQVQNFIGGDPDVVGRITPAVGLEYRFPFVGELGDWGAQTIEPIAQIVARPNEARIGRLPNEDAQSLVFDDTSLFEWDKFSGYDRAEGGVRANLGLKYAVTGANGFYADALFGQSYQLAGRNSFRAGDLVNAGRDSGLESRRSDYVARIHAAPTRAISFTARARFDEDDFSLRRVEAGAAANFNPWLPLQASITYARYEPQPELGLDRRREGILAAANYSLTPNWFVTGSALVDLDRYQLARDAFAAEFLENPNATYNRTKSWNVTGLSLGAGYTDECTTFSVTYSVTPRDFSSGTTESVKTLLFRLELRTLGEANLRSNLSGTSSQDGVANP
jgi:LPS-assembly protein